MLLLFSVHLTKIQALKHLMYICVQGRTQFKWHYMQCTFTTLCNKRNVKPVQESVIVVVLFLYNYFVVKYSVGFCSTCIINCTLIFWCLLDGMHVHNQKKVAIIILIVGLLILLIMATNRYAACYYCHCLDLIFGIFINFRT